MDTVPAGGGVLAAPGDSTPATRKRPYEREEKNKDDRFMDKMYKCNYFEDPAYAAMLRSYGLDLARDAAFDNLYERATRLHHAWLAARQLRTPAGYAAAKAIADEFCTLV